MLSPSADPDHRSRLILPSVFYDPDRFVGVEIFLALSPMLFHDLLVHFYPNAWTGRNLRLTILYLRLVPY